MSIPSHMPGPNTSTTAGHELRQVGLADLKTELAGLPRADLPTLGDSAAEGSRDTVAFKLPRVMCEQIEALAARDAGTSYRVLASAFAVLLARYTGQSDLAIGTVVANGGRVAPTPDGAASIAVLRCAIEGDPTFAELLAGINARVLGLREDPGVGLAEVLRELTGAAVGDDSPLLGAVFVYAGDPIGGAAEAARPERPLTLAGIPRCELALTLTAASGEMLGELAFAAPVFDRASAERFVRNFERLLMSIVAEPGGRVRQLAILTDDELSWLAARSEPRHRVPIEGVVLDRVLAQARRTPEAVAVVAGGRALSYRAVVARAALCADRLRRLGVGPEHPLVGIHLPRTFDIPVVMLAAWMAGGAYVPVDPDYPKARVRHIVEDSGLGVVVSCRAIAGELSDLSVRVLLAEDLGEPAEQAAAAIPAVTAAPALDALAYILYTSGSTGKPKGVMIEQRQFASLCRAMDLCLDGGPGDTWLAVSSMCFDISGVELLWTLTRGFRVVIAETQVAEWARYLELRPTHLQCTPSMIRQLLAGADGRALVAPLRRLITAGEALDPGLARRARSLFDGVLTNGYGPTEATVYASMWDVDSDAISLGPPVANTTLFIMDPSGQRVPRGCAGELWIGGEGVGRGYRGRPDLTDERFVRDPRTGARLYRTGDRVRYRADGSLEYLGRLDSLVKLRGYRIELGEIESVAAEHPAVVECAAIVRSDGGDPWICLYWMRSKDAATGAADLRQHLASRLPAYMMPANIVELAALPVTPAKKVDRLGLAKLPPPSSPSYQAPRTNLEAVFCDLFASVLGGRTVGIDDDFFALGGNSVLAAVVASRARARSVSLTLRDFHQYRSPRTLAAAFDARARG